MSSTDTVALKINLVFNVNISSNMKYLNLVFSLIEEYKNCKSYNKRSTLAD